MAAAKPVVALLTDFGVRDHYVGTMKAVVLSVCADAALVDITHEIAPQDVLGAALELEAAYRYFPPATVFLVVVDPGVGSARRAIAAEAGGHYFVGPDNGVCSLVFRQEPPRQVVELRERRFARPTISRTFEGRDRFAPAASWLALGTSLGEFGPAIDDWVTIEVPRAQATARAVSGEVVRIDRFGNLITNIEAALVESLPAAPDVRVGSSPSIPFVRTYADAVRGSLCALIGSSGSLEVAVNGGSAAEVLRASRGTSVTVTV